MNGRKKNTITFDNLTKQIENLPNGANVHVRVPLCIGWAHVFAKENFEDLVTGLREKAVNFTIYLNENPLAPEAVSSWMKQVEPVLSTLKKGVEVMQLSDWREKEEWLTAKTNYDAYYSKYLNVPITPNNTSVNLNTLYMRDAEKFYLRKYKVGGGDEKRSKSMELNGVSEPFVMDDTVEQNNKTAILENNKNYIKNEVLDCLSWMERSEHDFGTVSILMYHGDTYESMKDAYSKHPQEIGYKPNSLCFAKYLIKKPEINRTNEKVKQISPPVTPMLVELNPVALDALVEASTRISNKNPENGAIFFLKVIEGLSNNTQAASMPVQDGSRRLSVSPPKSNAMEFQSVSSNSSTMYGSGRKQIIENDVDVEHSQKLSASPVK